MVEVSGLEVRVLPIEALKPAPYNPRLVLKPSDPRYRKLAASLRTFGLVEPLIWNEVTGHVVGGHLRLSILRAEGVRELPVSVVRLTPEREQALNVLLNNQEAQGRYDPGLLADLLDGLRDLPELELTGFTHRDLASLRLEPLETPLATRDLEHVEICLRMDHATYARAQADLDRVIAAHALECHVRER